MAPGGSGSEFDVFLQLAEIIHAPIAQIMKPWSVTQTGNLTEQFKAGFRHIDLRAMWDFGEWRTHHALEGDRIYDMIMDIKYFIESHPYEVIIVELGHTDYSAVGWNNTELMYLISDIVGDYMLENNDTDIYDLTFKEIWEKNKRLLFLFDIFDDTLNNNKFTYLSKITEGYYANTPNVIDMIKHNNYLIKDRVNSFLLELSYTLTADVLLLLLLF